MIRRGAWLALPLLLAQLAVGCHLIFPFDAAAPAPADGGPGVDLQRSDGTRPVDLHQALDLPWGKPPPDLAPGEALAPDSAPPTCLAQTLLATKVSSLAWNIDGWATADTNKVTFEIDKETSIFFHPKPPVTVPGGCGFKVKISGSFSKGELYVMLYTQDCTTSAGCDSGGGVVTLCGLKAETSGTFSCIAPPLPTSRTFKTIRLRRPAATLVGAAKVTYLWLYAQ